ncbi:hypothetical protein DOY81_005013 [Sarcophaga bullata]|nr:hypothetical protein DOY81_005013 [Sarcophaga bullata]
MRAAIIVKVAATAPSPIPILISLPLLLPESLNHFQISSDFYTTTTTKRAQFIRGITNINDASTLETQTQQHLNT